MAYLKVPLEQGTVLIETEDLPGARPVSVLGDRSAQVVEAIEDSLSALHTLAMKIVTSLAGARPEDPDEVELTFGIKASAEMNALVVAKASGEANYSIKLKWVRAKSSS